MPKENIQFGHGSFVGEISRDPTFFDLPVRAQAKIIGWANSCPVTDELTDPDNPSSGRGPEAMRRRYAEVNLWYTIIDRAVEELNPELHNHLSASVYRELDEPVGKHEPANVPETHQDYMAPMGTLYGYALPRIMVEQVGSLEPNLRAEEVQQRVATGMEILESVIPKAKNPSDLLALFAEGLITKGQASAERVLYHCLGKGWMVEHESPTMLWGVKHAFQTHAPTAWSIYKSLSRKQKDKIGIV